MDEYNYYFNELIIIPTTHKIKSKEIIKKILTLIYNTNKKQAKLFLSKNLV